MGCRATENISDRFTRLFHQVILRISEVQYFEKEEDLWQLGFEMFIFTQQGL
jgi:hypothetical protein